MAKAILGFHVYVCASVDKNANYVIGLGFHGEAEWCFIEAKLVLGNGVGICPSIQEHLNHLSGTPLYCKAERSLIKAKAVGILDVQVFLA